MFNLQNLEILKEKYPQFAEVIQSIVDKTVYYTETDIIQLFRHSILDWKQARTEQPLYLLIDKFKIGSQHWLYLEVQDLLPEHQILTSSDQYFTNGEIVIFDDFSLSGNFMYGLFDEWEYYLSPYQKNKIQQLTYITALITEDAKRLFHNTRYPLSIYSQKELEVLNITDRKFLKEFQPDTECSASAIVCSYKIPNQFGTFAKIYNQIVTEPRNRDFMVLVESYWKAHPIFKN